MRIQARLECVARSFAAGGRFLAPVEAEKSTVRQPIPALGRTLVSEPMVDDHLRNQLIEVAPVSTRSCVPSAQKAGTGGKSVIMLR